MQYHIHGVMTHGGAKEPSQQPSPAITATIINNAAKKCSSSCHVYCSVNRLNIQLITVTATL